MLNLVDVVMVGRLGIVSVVVVGLGSMMNF